MPGSNFCPFHSSPAISSPAISNTPSYVLGVEISGICVVKKFIHVVDMQEARNAHFWCKCPGTQPSSFGWDLGQDGRLWRGYGSRLSPSNAGVDSWYRVDLDVNIVVLL